MARDEEFRVVWKRIGLKQKSKRYSKPTSAVRFIGILGPEPWLYVGLKNPDWYYCCSGAECGCGGETVKQHFENSLADVPKIEYVRLEVRNVGPWNLITERDFKQDGRI